MPKLPGWNAEDALYKTTGNYRLAASWTGGPTGQVVAAISCSSKDRTTDCFCPKGCYRTQTTCTCCGPQAAEEIGGGVFV